VLLRVVVLALFDAEIDFLMQGPFRDNYPKMPDWYRLPPFFFFFFFYFPHIRKHQNV